MDFISNQEVQVKEMLKTIGVEKVEDLFCAVPENLRLNRPEKDDGLCEYEGLKHMEALAGKNHYPDYANYLGCGAYEHHIPAIVGMITSRSEFLTAYTPYQAEASQGLLQSIFEFQSAICALTGLDVSNASVYDAASACAESMLMALRAQKKRHKLLVVGSLHPNYRGVVDQYLSNQDVSIVTIPVLKDGMLDQQAALELIDEDTAAILVQYPNFFGSIDDIKPLFAKAKEVGCLSIVCANPLVYGLYESAAELGADIAVGDCQPFGLPLHYGGPYAGYVACTQKLIRQLPGRIIGETVDTEGKRGFVLTLQAREQHIRREKATSNICTNQALAALSSLIAMLVYGKKGTPKLALTNFQRASYLKSALEAIPGVTILNHAPLLNEFAVHFGRSASEVQKLFRENRIEPGVDAGNFFPQFKDTFIVAVTETKNKEQLDHYIQTAKNLGGEHG